jgi:GNAT superfamily N-acetyltransferase
VNDVATQTLPVVVRPMLAGDLGFVLNSWLRSYHESDVARYVPNDVYFADAGHHGICVRLLQETPALMACDAANPHTLYGWVCGAPGVLHYAYVKSPFRRLGIARLLLQHAGVEDGAVCTHFTRATKAWQERGHRYVYNPYALRGDER